MNCHRLFREVSDRTSVQAFRFTLVGLVAFAFDFSFLMFAVTVWHWNHFLAAAVAYLIGLCVNYVLCIRWVFSRRRFQDRRMEFVLFALIGITGLGLTEVILWVGTGMLHADIRLSKFAALFAVAAWNFALRKALLFSELVQRRPRRVKDFSATDTAGRQPIAARR